MKFPKDILVIVGPTGSGKSSLAMELAAGPALQPYGGGEIISCDSVQVYRGFDIGAAKPTQEDMQKVRHHLIDVVDWCEDFDAARFAELAAQAIADVQARGHVPIVVGGTGLYLRALLNQQWHDLPKDDALRAEFQALSSDDLYTKLQLLDPTRAAALHPNDRFRVGRALELVTLLGKPLHEVTPAALPSSAYKSLMIMLEPPRALLHERIAARVKVMLAAGLVAEVKALLAAGVTTEAKPMQSIGYKQVTDVLLGRAEDSLLEAAMTAATRQYAKRQLTWFRKVPMDLRLENWTSAVVESQILAIS